MFDTTGQLPWSGRGQGLATRPRRRVGSRSRPSLRSRRDRALALCPPTERGWASNRDNRRAPRGSVPRPTRALRPEGQGEGGVSEQTPEVVIAELDKNA